MSRTAPTLLSRLVGQLRALARAPDGEVPPAVILWFDPEGEWRPLLPLLLREAPELLQWGDFDPTKRTGPAIWLRCAVERTVPVEGLVPDAVPIVYLPGTTRQTLLSGEQCPRELQPLVELLFRGADWKQRSRAEWGVMSFLTSAQGLGLDIARDGATRSALQRALREVALLPLAHLEKGRLDSADFDQLLSSDVLRDLLRWMEEPEATRQRMGEAAWAAFVALCRKRLDFDPQQEGALKAGARLGAAEGAFGEVWARFEEAPEAYRGIAALLRRAPQSMFPESHWPKRNDDREKELASALREAAKRTPVEAAERIAQLERDHAGRRQWVWARLGESPLARAIEWLARLAEATKRVLGGGSPEALKEAYVQHGWVADAAAWQVLATVPVEYESLLADVVQKLAANWLDESARAFQSALERSGGLVNAARGESPPGECRFFVDGLRYDLGRLLADRLAGRGARVELEARWTALPTVTATGKPAVTPIAESLVGTHLGEEFAPQFRDGRAVQAASLRTAIADAGWRVLEGEDDAIVTCGDARGYLEYGDLDALGHDRQQQFPRQIAEQLDRIVERITRLLDAGWSSVRVVTDHGWLYLPRGLPSIDLPRHLTKSRWARCAVVAGGSQVNVPRVAWHWNPVESVAVAPGASCFNQSPSYAHGGLSLQECLTPELVVTRAGERSRPAVIRSVSWRGMRCTVEADASPGTRVDLRLGAANGESVARTVKVLDTDGVASLVVADDRHEKSTLVVVLLGPDQSLLSQQDTRVGE